MIKALVGDTFQVTWVNSGVTPTSLVAAVYNGSETMIDSGTMTSSGNGHYYYDHTVSSSAGFYVAETVATINSAPYKRRIRFKAVNGEVD